MLIRIMVVNGKNSRRPGRSMMMSPGNRPRGKRDNQGQSRPATRSVPPTMIKKRCMMLEKFEYCCFKFCVALATEYNAYQVAVPVKQVAGR